MTEQEQKAFTAMREALESSAVCIQLMSDGPSRASWGDTLDIIDSALTAANAVSRPQTTEPRTTEQIVLDMEVWFEAQEPMPDSMTAAKEFARRIRNQTEQDIAKVIQRRGWELMRSENGYFLRDATAWEAHHE